MKIGLILGSVRSVSTSGMKGGMTPYGKPSTDIAGLKIGKARYRVICRHSIPPSIPPHMVNHRANIWALREDGVDHIISVCSTGALRSRITVPSLAVPDDYIDLSPRQTFFDDRIRHVTPSLDEGLMEGLKASMKGVDIPWIFGGVYIQTPGPRLETAAEVRMLSRWGDYVGMNFATEAALANEMDIPVAGLLTVDNHANGVMDERLDFQNILSSARDKWEFVRRVLGKLPSHL